MIVTADMMGLPVKYEGKKQINPYMSRNTGYNVLQSLSHFRYVGV